MSEIIRPTEVEMSELVPFLKEALHSFKKTWDGKYSGNECHFALPIGRYNNYLHINGCLARAHAWPEKVEGYIVGGYNEGPKFDLYNEAKEIRTSSDRTEWEGFFDLENIDSMRNPDERNVAIPLKGGIEVWIRKD